ncbi:hypothetical protein D3C80_1592650 [compost metagenome]
MPVGVALIGTKVAHEATRNIDSPSSFLAISELTSRLVGGNLFDSDSIDWNALLDNLPETPSVAENQGSVVLEYQDKYHIKLGQGDWVPYPGRGGGGERCGHGAADIRCPAALSRHSSQ